jgi:biotin carboxyl carrier protein
MYDVEINGRVRRIEILRRGGTFEVTLDGRQQAAGVSVTNGIWSVILSDVEEGQGGTGTRRSYEIAIVEHPSTGDLSVHVNGRLVTASVGGARPAFARRGHEAAAGGKGPAKVLAPMPGKVVKVLVKPGDTVVARQGVVVVEAMKMENELRAPKAGTVSEVHATEGSSVDAGATLIIIE